MKRVFAKSLVALLGIALLTDSIHDFYANNTVEFFASRPQRLWYVFAITAVGAVLTFLFSRLSPASQLRAKLIALGGLAGTMSALLGYWGYLVLRMALALPPTDGGQLFTATLLFALAMVGALNSWLWYEFYHLLKHGRTRFI